MPKLIEHLREDILSVSKQILLTDGYAALTMRKVAAQCGIAAGTLYHYFENKDMLVANIILEDWLSVLTLMRQDCLDANSPEDGFCAVYGRIVSFQAPYLQIWEQYSFSGKSRSVFYQRHLQLVEQLRVIVHELLERFGLNQVDSIERFLAENLLTFANERRNFAPFAEITRRISHNKGE